MILTFCDNKIYIKENIKIELDIDFHSDLDSMFDKMEVSSDPSQNGIAKSTVAVREYNPLHDLRGWPQFRNDVIKEINLGIAALGRQPNFFTLGRHWTNRMYEGCRGGSHHHSNGATYVAVYYYEAPPNSGKYILYKEDPSDQYDCDLTVNNKVVFDVAPGTLILHRANLYHGISTHQSKNHRTVFVFEMRSK